LFLVSFLALVANIAVFVYHFAKVLKYKRNIAVGVHFDLGEYRALAAERPMSAQEIETTLVRTALMAESARS
jgi:hypothetical protein